jgi:4-hydroxyphenylpyruvate dioxygenase
VRAERSDASSNRFGFSAIDHLTSNFLTLQPAIMWMQQVLGFERYWGIEFHTEDVRRSAGGGSGLKSIVMWDPRSGIKFANNEPAAPAFHASQIYRFCEEHRGPGVQHVALSVANILDSVRDMRTRGVGFMPTPAAYYAQLPERLVELGVQAVEESLDELRELEVLVDGDGPERYLLQIFLRDAAALFADRDAGPLFIELIQRKGDRGFGAGNFRALFESIEREQQAA